MENEKSPEPRRRKGRRTDWEMQKAREEEAARAKGREEASSNGNPRQSKLGTPQAAGGQRAHAMPQSAMDAFLNIVDPQAYDGVTTPLEFMLLVMQDTRLTFNIRFAAAKECLPYMHPRHAAKPFAHEKKGKPLTVNLVRFAPEDLQD